MSAPDAKLLRQAFGSFMTGVTVVTARDQGGAPVGFTANSFSSVSMDPPLLLVCPGRFLSSFDVFRNCSHFGVSILAEGQEDVSNTFAQFKGDRFAKVAWTPVAEGTPLIDGAAAQFSCRTSQAIDAGDHAILIGKVLDATVSDRPGLGYAGGRYFSIGLERTAAAPRDAGTSVSAILEHDAKVLLETVKTGLRPPQIELNGGHEARATLAQHFADAGLSVTIGPTYAIYDDRATGQRHICFQAQADGPDTGGLGAYYPIDGLTSRAFTTPAYASMMTRFAEEHRTSEFGLYIGDDRAGDIERHSNRT